MNIKMHIDQAIVITTLLKLAGDMFKYLNISEFIQIILLDVEYFRLQSIVS